MRVSLSITNLFDHSSVKKIKKKSVFLYKFVFFLISIFLINTYYLIPVSYAQDNQDTEVTNPIANNNSNPSPINPPVSQRVTSFEWDPINQAKSYELEIIAIGQPGEQKDIFRFTVNEASWRGELKPGLYSMKLRSRDRRGVPGEWSTPEQFYVKLYAPVILFPLKQQILKSNQDENYELTLQWEFQSEASRYQIHIEDSSKNFVRDLETSENNIKISVPVAKNYSWSIKGFDKQGKEGEQITESIPFQILGKKLITPKVKRPENPFVRNLEWSTVPFSENYKYILYFRNTERKWSPFKEEKTSATNFSFDPKWSGGEYKLSVYAESPLREQSKTHSLVFKVATGDRSPEAEVRAAVRQSINRTVDWYFMASYLITQIQYSSVNVDQGSAPTLNALGGTGRLGAGYLSENNPYGFLGIVDLSGFIIDRKNYTYPGLEAQGIIRWSSGTFGEFRLSGGGYYKEIPEIIGDSLTGDISVSQLKALGLHAGGEYWYSLNSKLGVQINGRVYIPISGKTPNSQKMNPTPSYQFGFLGSLRLNSKATGLMGYAYRKDQIEYKATNSTAIAAGYTQNTTSVVGHYLNFFLEWDL